MKAMSYLCGLLLAALATAAAAAEDPRASLTAEHRLTPQDDVQIRQVIARLNHALDAGDYALYGSHFDDQGVFVSGFGNAVGPRQVAEALEKVAPYITNKRHVAANLVISGRGHHAVVTSYLIVFERVASLSYVGSAINVDTLQRKNGRWRVVRHESTLDPATAAALQAVIKPPAR